MTISTGAGVLVAVASVLSLALTCTILSVRIGRLIGRVEAAQTFNATEHERIWASIGRNTDRIERVAELRSRRP